MKHILWLSIALSLNAFAWGPTGHRVVGEVATKFLTAQSLNQVNSILGGQSLARVSNWPDEIKSEPQTYQYTFNWHYTDWGDEVHEHDETTSSGLLLTSIRDQLKILKDPSATPTAKAFALKMVVHLVGDLHMPLHVGNGLDQGGNNCRVYFHNKATNLHALWDEGLIEFTKLSFTEMTNFVSQARKPADVQSWKTGDLVDWARESKNLRLTIYPKPIDKGYCRKELPVADEELPRLAYEYSYQFMPIVEQRLFQAGVRLAVLLNQTL
jgi:hypothetical protein